MQKQALVIAIVFAGTIGLSMSHADSPGASSAGPVKGAGSKPSSSIELTESGAALNPKNEDAADAAADALVDEVIRREPALRVALAAAFRNSDFNTEEMKSWRGKARLRNLAPDMRLRYGYNEASADTFQVVNPDTPLVDSVHLNDQALPTDSFSVSVGWSFSDLVFDLAQVEVNQELRHQHELKIDLTRRITEVYYERMALLVESLEPKANQSRQTKILHRLKIHETTDLLNSLCGEHIFVVPGDDLVQISADQNK